MQLAAVPVGLRYCVSQNARCIGVPRGLPRRPRHPKHAVCLVHALSRSGATPCTVSNGSQAALGAVALALAVPAAAWATTAAAAPLPAITSLLSHAVVRARALLTALLATEPSSYALGMTGALVMMLLTGVTLRRMDPSQTPTGPSLPCPSRSSALAAHAAASLGAAMATTPRPSIRDVLAARPPKARRTSTTQADTPPAVLSSALAAANAPGRGAGPAARPTSPTTTNTVSALKHARAARAAGLTQAVEAVVDRAVDSSSVVQHAGVADVVAPRQQPPPSSEAEDAVSSAATAVLSSMGLTGEPSTVRDRYDLWKAFLDIEAPTVRSKYDPWTHIRQAAQPAPGGADVWKVLVSVEAPKGEAPLDPLRDLRAWNPPRGAPRWDPLRALLGIKPPAAGGWSVFRGLAEVPPPQGLAPWDVVGALLLAEAPRGVKSKYDLLQGLGDLQAPTTVSKYDIKTDLNNARPPTGEAFNMLKDLVATVSKAASKKVTDRDAPWGVVGLGSATRPDGTTVNVFGVTVNNKQR